MRDLFECPRRPEEALDPLVTVTVGYKPLDIGAGNLSLLEEQAASAFNHSVCYIFLPFPPLPFSFLEDLILKEIIIIISPVHGICTLLSAGARGGQTF